MWEYTDTVKELFLRPKNAGELPGANAIGEVGSLSCGDALKLFLKINENEVIEDASFLTFGCGSAIASSSILTEMLKGKTVEEASKITNKDIVAQLGGLPREKMHCSVMGEEALEAALKNWRGEAASGPHCHDEVIVCKCFGVSDEHIRKTVAENELKTVDEVTDYTKAGGGCGDCLEDIQVILDELQGLLKKETTSKPALTNVQRMKKILHLLDEEINPVLKTDGGSVELIDVNGPLVTVAMRGNCTGCKSRQITLSQFIEKVLHEHVDSDIIVEEVNA